MLTLICYKRNSEEFYGGHSYAQKDEDAGCPGFETT